MKRMIKQMVLMLCMTTLTLVAVHAQTYDDMWRQVEKAQADDLPRRVLSVSEALLKKARKKGDFAWQMKAWVTIVTTRMSIDPDSFDIELLPQIHPDGICEQAIYHAVMATAYHAAMRSPVRAYDAETLGKYAAARNEHFAMMMAGSDRLAAADIEPYMPLMSRGADSRLFGHDMLSVFTRFDAQNNPSLDARDRARLYADAAQIYAERGNAEAYTLMQLEYIRSARGYSPDGIKEYGESLRTLLEQSDSLDAGADVAMELLLQPEVFADRDERLGFARWAARRFVKSKLANAFTNVERQIMQPSLQIDVADEEHVMVGGRGALITLSYHNMRSAKLEVRLFNGLDSRNRPKTDGRLICSRSYTFDTIPDNRMRIDRDLPFDGEQTDTLTLPAGKYVVVGRNGNTEAVKMLNISTLTFFTYNLPGGRTHVAVVSAATGRPAGGARVSYSADSGKTWADVYADGHGEVELKAEGRLMVKAGLPGTDDETPSILIASPRRPAATTETQVHTKLYTDRAIYRPGQALHLSGIVYEQHGDDTHTVAHAEREFKLYDAGGEVVSAVTAQTDDWGVAEADFILPVGRMPGSYRIGTDGSSVEFRVEEYKRPTFTVETRQAMDAGSGREYSFGDSLEVEALVKTYSGVPVQGAKVSYKTYMRIGRWRLFGYQPWNETGQGETTTDGDGLAHVVLNLTDTDVTHDARVSYKVTFDVTSQTGETWSESFQTTISKQGFALAVETGKNIYDQAHPADIVIKAENAQGQLLDVKGRYDIRPTQKTPDYWKYNPDAVAEDTPAVWEDDFESGRPLHLPRLTAGCYQICAYATDSRGNKINTVSGLTVFNSAGATPLLGKRSGERNEFSEPLFHFMDDDNHFSTEKPATLFVAPAADDVCLNYIIMSDDAVTERHSVELGREIRKLTIPYRTEYAGGVTVILYYAKDGKSYIDTRQVVLAEPDKQLRLEWRSFRDRLYPGQDEEWILTVKDKNGNAISGASLMATMYDSSLDALHPHSWNLALNFPRRLQSVYANTPSPNTGVRLFINPTLTLKDTYARTWDELTTYVRPTYASRVMREMRGGLMMAMAKAADSMETGRIEPESVTSDMADDAADAILQSRVAGLNLIMSEDQPAEGRPTIQPRTDFAETAFFASHILTDTDGDAHICFTLPESLTEWQFMALAHTRDMDYAHIQAKAVARKDFMIMPGMPRFVREGDKANISTAVINRTAATLKADIHFRLFDAATMTEIHAQTKTVEVGAGETEAVCFDFDVTDTYPMLVCETTGESTGFSDGERQYLPVLTAKRYITETIPFYITASETSKDIDIGTLFNNGSTTATGKRMTLEFTQNPEWTVIEALEAVKVPKRVDAPTLAAALYSNVTAARLAQSVPGLRQALSADWQTPAQNAPATSNLDATSDYLRDIISQESPFLRDANKEAYQRAELIDFFNPELIQARTSQARDRLLALQREDGAWSWFEGMDASYYITLSVCEMLAMLNDESTSDALIQGMNYLDNKELEWYNDMKRRKQSVMPSETTLHYLYVSSFVADRRVSSEVRAMREAYMKVLARSSRSLSIYGKANGACILRAFGHTDQADKLLQSAVEYTITRPGMGRYYATDRALYSWRDYRIPTHLATMQAIRQSERPDRDTILADMQLWLIRQKQVQMWDNPMNTIAAVGFMMNQDREGTISQMRTTRFDIDHQPIEVAADTARFLARQLGYVRENLPVATSAHTMQTLHIEQSVTDTTSTPASSHIAYGAIYAQCLDNLSAIGSHTSSELEIGRKYLKDGKEFDPSTTALAVGDRVTVRLIIRADRDFDFLQVRSGHPACFEPVSQLSGHRWMNGRGGYVSMHDASTDVFFDRFTRGQTTFDIDFYVTRTGTYLSDIATVQCAYSPEFCSHTQADTLRCK